MIENRCLYLVPERSKIRGFCRNKCYLKRCRSHESKHIAFIMDIKHNFFIRNTRKIQGNFNIQFILI